MESNKSQEEEEVRTGNAEDPSLSKKSFQFIQFVPAERCTGNYKWVFRTNVDWSEMASLRSYKPPIKVEQCVIGVNHLNHLFIRYGPLSHVLWNDARLKESPTVFFFGPDLKNAQWSPLGTYLATPLRKMTTLWGNAKGRYSGIAALMHYHHHQVEQVGFSPAEKYLVSYSKPSNPLEHWLKIFVVSTGLEFLSLDGQGSYC